MAVVLRHVEPSCDKDDIENMSSEWNKYLLVRRPKDIKLELFWSSDEADYVELFCGPNHKIVAVGAFVTDAYISGNLQKSEDFCKKHGLDSNKPTILLSSPWGLLDIDSDKMGHSSTPLINDQEACTAWLKMVGEVQEEVRETHNILVTLHPGVLESVQYSELTSKYGISVDTKSTAVELLSNCDFLVHSGSTMAIEMHLLDKPSFQFGDINSLEMSDGNWWHRKNTTISMVSPFFNNGREISEAIKKSNGKSNADLDVIKKLENGRYGLMDGKATIRAACEINKLKGKFKINWPKPTRDQSTAIAFDAIEKYFMTPICSVCNERFWFVSQQYLDRIKNEFNLSSPLLVPNSFACPFCGSPISGKMKFDLPKR